MRVKVCTMILLMAAAGCGGGDSPAPTPTPLPTGITITASTDLMKLRGTEPLGLSATFDNGTTSTVQGTWSSDNSAVASVDGSGRVTGASSGEATIAATYQTFRATHRLRVVPDFHGRWSGDHRLTGCTADGDFQRGNFCGEFTIGDLFLLNMALTQNRDAVTGTSDFGDPPSAVQGSIRTSGHLALAGTFTVAIEPGVVVEATLVDWEATSTDNERMTGRFSLVLRVAQLQGSARLDNDRGTVRKVTPTPAAVRSVTGGRTVYDALKRAFRRK
jgi:hypothetical protein